MAEQSEEHDCCFLVAGKLGVGKSMFTLHCVEEIDRIKNTETPINNICNDLPPFFTALKRNHDEKTKGTIVLDEGRDLAGINAIKGINKAMIKAFEVMRKDGFITFICFSNPMRMQSYFQEDRIKGLFFIKKRGTVAFFNYNQLLGIREKFDKAKTKSLSLFNQFKPRFLDSFSDYKGKLREAYNKQKDQGIGDVLGSIAEEFGIEEQTDKNYLTISETARYLKVAANTVNDWCNIGLRGIKLPFEWKGHLKMVKREDADKWQQMRVETKGLQYKMRSIALKMGDALVNMDKYKQTLNQEKKNLKQNPDTELDSETKSLKNNSYNAFIEPITIVEANPDTDS